MQKKRLHGKSENAESKKPMCHRHKAGTRIGDDLSAGFLRTLIYDIQKKLFRCFTKPLKILFLVCKYLI